MNPKLNPKELKSRLKQAGVELLQKYKGAKEKHRFRCCRGHTWKAVAYSVFRGCSCPQCGKDRIGEATSRRVSPEDLKRRLKKAGLELLDKYEGILGKRYRFRCKKRGHEWEGSASVHLIDGCGCNQCMRESRRLSEPELRKRIRKVDDTIELRSVSYPGSKLHLQCKKCGHKWKGLLGNLEAGFCLCRNCNPDAVSEHKVRKVIEKMTGTKWPRANPSEVPFLHGLHLDGYDRENKRAFEFDGGQHNEVSPFFHGSGRRAKQNFLKGKRRDWRKNIQCRRHGVVLIRIPYRKRDDEDYIREKLLRMGMI